VPHPTDELVQGRGCRRILSAKGSTRSRAVCLRPLLHSQRATAMDELTGNPGSALGGATDGAAPEPRRKRLPAGKAFALVVATLLLCDLAAGVLLVPRDRVNFRTSHPYYHHGMIPLKTGLSQWGTGKPYPVVTNSLGLLDSAVREIALQPSRRRVVFLGDSYTEGVGVPFEETFVGLLATRLAPAGVEVLNAGEMSYSPKLYHLKAKYLLEQVGLRFDELIVFIDISDIQDQVLYRKFVPREETSWERLRASVWKRVKASFFSAHTLSTYLRARQRERDKAKYNAEVYPPWLDYFWLENKDTEAYGDPDFPHIRSEWTSDAYFDNRWTDLGVALALEDMRKLVELCREHEVELTLAVYPWPDQIYAAELECRQVFLWETFCAENELRFINLFPAFMQQPTLSAEEIYAAYFIGEDVHWNPAGHRLVADAVEPHLRR
jgi:hypothetical protein